MRFFCHGLLVAAFIGFWAQAALALSLSAPERVTQGQPFTVQVQAAPNARIGLAWLDQRLDLVTGGDGAAEVLLGVSVDDGPGPRQLTVESGPEQAVREIRVLAGKFPEQRLTVPKAMAEPPKEDMARIAREREAARTALSTVSPERLWRLPMAFPLGGEGNGEVSSAYGLKRFFNGLARRPHMGVDFRAKMGDPVLSVADGVVLLTGDHYFSGRCVYLDHGQGVISMYFHLSRVAVGQGERVRAGQPVGEAGSTGRSTAPHLHFGLSALGRLVDPLPLLARRQDIHGEIPHGQKIDQGA